MVQFVPQFVHHWCKKSMDFHRKEDIPCLLLVLSLMAGLVTVKKKDALGAKPFDTYSDTEAETKNKCSTQIFNPGVHLVF